MRSSGIALHARPGLRENAECGDLEREIDLIADQRKGVIHSEVRAPDRGCDPGAATVAPAVRFLAALEPLDLQRDRASHVAQRQLAGNTDQALAVEDELRRTKASRTFQPVSIEVASTTKSMLPECCSGSRTMVPLVRPKCPRCLESPIW